MTTRLPSALVESVWLEANLPNVTVIDASWHFASTGRDADAEYLEGRIPGARRFDIDGEGFSDKGAPLAHTIPSDASAFGAAAAKIGVRAGKPVVIYGKNENYFGVTRAWWLFRTFGKMDVAVLNGGFKHWKGPVESGEPPPLSIADGDTVFEAVLNRKLVRYMPEMVVHSRENDALIIDVRGAGRFAGTSAEPRPGLREGHIPGSINVPYGGVTNDDGKFLSPEDLRAFFEKNHVPLGDKERTIVASCGSGVSACNTALALHVADGQDIAVYDGSWTEYGREASNPVSKSE